MNSVSPITSALLCGLVLCRTAPGLAEDWPHWRGPNRNGVVSERSYWNGKNWPPAEPEWKVRVGVGSSSPLVVGNWAYTMGWEGGKDTIHCLDTATGESVWSVSYSCPEYGRYKNGDEGLYSGPSSTPEYDDETGYLYTLSTDGDLNCWDTAQRGRNVWSKNLYGQYKVPRRPKVGRQGLRDYGYTSSPLVLDDHVIVEVGSSKGNLIAFDRRTGREVWASENNDPAGHNAGPVPITVEGVPCVAVLTILGLNVVRLDPGNEGKSVASFPWVTDFANNIASPVIHGDQVLLTSAYNHNAICKLHVTLRGAKRIWEKPYASKVCTPVVYNGHVYWAWRRLHCLNWETGVEVWEGGNYGDPGSCIVTKDGRIIVWGNYGRLALVDTADRSPDRYHELALRDIGNRSHAWPHVVLSGGRLYCKDRSGNLQCFRLAPRP